MRSRNSLHSFQHEPGGSAPRPPSVRATFRSRRAFTLVEVMVATIIFATSILGVYAVMIRAYQMVTLARYRDNARAVLGSFTDQFGRLQTADQLVANGPSIIRPMFQVDITDPFTPTGFGLTWTDAEGRTYPTTTTGLSVVLGGSDSTPIPAVVTRQVLYLNPANGVAQANQPNSAAGWILQGTFTITYKVDGHAQVQQLTSARSVH